MVIKTRTIEMECPFCEKGKIPVVHVPIFLKFKKGPYGGGKAGISRTTEKSIMQEEKCPNCGKSKKEIQNYLDGKTKKAIDPEKLKKRLKEAGLPTVIESKPR